MNLKQLSYLAALYKTSSFTAAAKACGVSQSTLSGGIAALEAALGAVLVERSKGGGVQQHVLFTPLGEGVVARAAPMLAAAQDLQAFVDSGQQPMQGTLTLAAIPSIAPFVLAPFILAAQAQFPKLKLQLREQQTAPLLEHLRDGTLDMGIIALPYDTTGLHVMPLYQEPLLLLSAAHDELASIAAPTLAHLKPERLILLEEGHCLRAHTLHSCSVAERSSAAMEASSLATLVQLVEAGLGVALLPAMAVRSRLVQPGIAAGTLVAHAFAKPAPQRGIAITTRSTHSNRAAIALLGELLHRISRV
jgi:LysR family transcriptional regulator, hydrogen peroxide-inducible genes activator